MKHDALRKLRIDGEVAPEEFARQPQELHERHAAIHLQLEPANHGNATSQTLRSGPLNSRKKSKNRWKTCDNAETRAVREILCESVLLNSEKLENRLQRPFDSPSNGLSVSQSGAEESRTPDLIIANDALYQLSYRPITCKPCHATRL